MESENESGIDKHQKNNDGDHSTQDKSFKHSNSSTSSYTSSSDSNPLESDVDVNDSVSRTKSENDDFKSTPADWSMMSVSPRSAYSQTEYSTFNSVPTTLPSPPQGMGRPPEYPGFDPNRIPQSVFVTNKHTSAMEWSVASNESMFSIQMGTMSFTRDHFNNLFKSGELQSPDQEFMNNSPGLPPITETSSNNLQGLAVVNEDESDNDRESTSSIGRKSLELEAHKTNKETCTSPERIRLSERTSNVSDGHGMHPALEPHTPSRVSHQSDGSRMSTSSFAFPVLGGETPSKSRIQKSQLQPEAPEVPEKTAEARCFTCSFCTCSFCSCSFCWWPFSICK